MATRIKILTLALGCAASVSCGEDAGDKGQAGMVTLKLSMHANHAFEEGYQELIDAYQTAHPKIRIVTTRADYDGYAASLDAELMSDTSRADIVQMFGSWTCAYAAHLAKVPSETLSVAQAESMYFAPSIGGFVCDEELYGMPQEYNLEYGGLLVNKQMVLDAGLAYPPNWESMDDVLSYAERLSKFDENHEMLVAGLHFMTGDAISNIFMAGILQSGAQYWTSDHTAYEFDTPEAARTVEWMKAAVERGVIDPVAFRDTEVRTDFFQGKVAMAYIGTWAINQSKIDFPEFGEYGYFAIPPMFGDEHKFTSASGWGLAIPRTSKHAKEALDFINFVAADSDNSAKWNEISSTIPALVVNTERTDLLEAQKEFLPAVKPLLRLGSYAGFMPERDRIYYEIIPLHLGEALTSTSSIESTLDLINQEANDTL